jgi:uncharacterized protein (TIGR03437 family)
MSETNSCYDGGQTGVSDVFASALWAADYMFLLASYSATGVNFHGGGSGAYTPIEVDGSTITARPLYYALLMFQMASQGTMVPLTLNANGVDLTAYAVEDSAGALRVLVINKDASQNASVAITPGAGYTSAQTLSLSAPALDATSGITLGGTAVASDGTWSPGTVSALDGSGGVFIAAVPAGSALLIGFGNGSAAIVNSASGKSQVAPDSMASVYGPDLAFAARSAASAPFPSTLAAVSATVTDSAGVSRAAPLIYVSPSLVNLVIPAGTATGSATVGINGASATASVSSVAPALFTMEGTLVAAADAYQSQNGAGAISIPVFSCNPACQLVPIPLTNQSSVLLSLYGTGIRRASLVTCTIAGIPVPVQYAGPQGTYDGFDQVNIVLPARLQGMGVVNVVITADGENSNTVQIDLG